MTRENKAPVEEQTTPVVKVKSLRLELEPLEERITPNLGWGE